MARRIGRGPDTEFLEKCPNVDKYIHPSRIKTRGYKLTAKSPALICIAVSPGHRTAIGTPVGINFRAGEGASSGPHARD